MQSHAAGMRKGLHAGGCPAGKEADVFRVLLAWPLSRFPRVTLARGSPPSVPFAVLARTVPDAAERRSPASPMAGETNSEPGRKPKTATKDDQTLSRAEQGDTPTPSVHSTQRSVRKAKQPRRLSKAQKIQNSLTQPVHNKTRRGPAPSTSLASPMAPLHLPLSDDLVYLRPTAVLQHQGAGWLQHNKPGTFTFSTEYMAQMRRLDSIWKRNTQPQEPQSKSRRNKNRSTYSNSEPQPQTPISGTPTHTSSASSSPALPSSLSKTSEPNDTLSHPIISTRGEYSWVSGSQSNITNETTPLPLLPTPPEGLTPEEAAHWQDKARWLKVNTRKSSKPSNRRNKPASTLTHDPTSDDPPREIRTSLTAAQKIQEVMMSFPSRSNSSDNSSSRAAEPAGSASESAHSSSSSSTQGPVRSQLMRQSAHLQERGGEVFEESEEEDELMEEFHSSPEVSQISASRMGRGGREGRQGYSYSLKQVVLIRDIFEASGLDSATASAKLRALVPMTKQVVLNMALLALAKARVDEDTWKSIKNLLNVMMNLGCMNEHSYGSAVTALRLVHRFDLALDLFEETCRRGDDFGPVGSSNLLRCCASDRNLTLAMSLFDRMVQCNVTLNKYSYNSLLHLCASMSHMESAQTVLTLMRSDSREGNTPDSYTYSAMLRALSNCKQWDMLEPLYHGMVKRGLEADIEVWCQLITAASYAGRLELSCQFFADMKQQGVQPNLYIYNAMIAALGRCDGTVAQAMGLYKEMLSLGVCVDHYTYNGLLTTMAHKHASLAQVEDLVREMSRHGVRLNTFVGASLIHAYRHVPELTYAGPEMKAMLLSSVDRVLSHLRRERMANGQVFSAVMALHAQVGDAVTVKTLMKDMVESGIPATRFTYQMVGRAFEECGEVYFAEQCKAKLLQIVQAEKLAARELRGERDGRIGGREGRVLTRAELEGVDERGHGVGPGGNFRHRGVHSGYNLPPEQGSPWSDDMWR